MTFNKGQSGNPNGKPKGIRSKATVFAEKLLEDDSEAIVKAIVAAARTGDPTAMRICAERIIPLRKGRPVVFDLPPVAVASDIIGAIGEISRAMSAGELTVDEASAAASIIEMHRRAIETVELEQRLQRLEERVPL